MVDENAVENRQVSDPYFINENIDFINFPFVSIEDKFIYPERISKFVQECSQSIDHVKLEIVDDENQQMQVRAIVGTIRPSTWNYLLEPDATKIKLTLQRLAIDYTPQSIIKEFIADIKTGDTINHARYDLKRFENWVQQKSNRTFKQEFFYRIGIELPKLK